MIFYFWNVDSTIFYVVAVIFVFNIFFWKWTLHFHAKLSLYMCFSNIESNLKFYFCILVWTWSHLMQWNAKLHLHMCLWMTLGCNFLFLPPNKILQFLQIVQMLLPLSLDWIRCCDSLHLSKECPTQCLWCLKRSNCVFCISHILFPKCYIPTIFFW